MLGVSCLNRANSYSTKAENQHYVPQFLLRNFAIPKKGKKTKEQHIYVYDKQEDRIFSPNIDKHVQLFYPT